MNITVLIKVTEDKRGLKRVQSTGRFFARCFTRLYSWTLNQSLRFPKTGGWHVSTDSGRANRQRCPSDLSGSDHHSLSTLLKMEYPSQGVHGDPEATKPQVRTNGYLCGDFLKIRAIMVVKLAVLTNELVVLATQMQESAQMVAWITSDTAPAQRRHTVYVLISLFIYSRSHIAMARNPIRTTATTYGGGCLDNFDNKKPR